MTGTKQQTRDCILQGNGELVQLNNDTTVSHTISMNSYILRVCNRKIKFMFRPPVGNFFVAVCRKITTRYIVCMLLCMGKRLSI